MSLRIPRWPVLLASALFLAALLAWLAWTPYRPERVDAALPADLVWVSWHDAPGERWPELTRNPLVQAILAEVLGPEAAGRAAGESLHPRLRGLTADRVALAQGRADPLTGQTAWYGVAWTGTRGRRLRWQLKLFRPAGFVRYGQHGGRPLYRVKVSGLPPGQRLHLTFEEGLVLAALSSDPHDVRRLLDTHDGLRPSVRDLDMVRQADVSDQARIPDIAPSGADLVVLFNRLDAGQTDLHLRVGATADTVRTDSRPRRRTGRDLPWGHAPQATATLTVDSLLRIAAAAGVRDLVEDARRLLLAPDDAELTVGLFGLPYTGRYRGMRVPGLVLALPSDREAEQADAAVRHLIDRINARWQWGLIPSAVPESQVPLRRISGTGTGPIGNLPPNEVPAYALDRGHLLLSSNVQTLQRILEADLGSEPARGLPRAEEDAGLWIDLQRAAPTLRLAFGVYQLYQIMERREPGPTERALADMFAQRLPDLEGLGQAEAGFRQRPGRFEMRLRIRHLQGLPEPCID